ncbi:hypothetical protein ACGF0K_16860 [Streptomyces sp. NPDC048156]|uniref:hypothetical protein n=1 Tax=Streptomyces sp. NPDC048156 TaxID=3365502 RepID=UPI00370F9468
MEHEDRVLMLVLTGEPLPPDDRDDPESVAVHAAAEADVALLGDQLRGIGDALAARAGPGRVPAPRPLVAPRPRRRPFAVAFGALAAVCAAVMLGGLVWLAVDGGPGMSESASDKSASDAKGDAGGGAQEGGDLTPEGFVACSRLMVEGTVDRVAPEPGGRDDRITLTVTRYYKPASGSGKVMFLMDRDVEPRLKPGDHTLITVPKRTNEPDNWATGKEIKPLRDMIVNALPGSRGLKCGQGGGPGA